LQRFFSLVSEPTGTVSVRPANSGGSCLTAAQHEESAMTTSSTPIRIGRSDGAFLVGLLLAAIIDGALIELTLLMVEAVRDYEFRIPMIIGIAAVLVGGTTWMFWRAVASRLEISAEGICVIGLMGRQMIPLEAVMRVEAVDGRTLRSPLVGHEGSAMSLPVLTLRVSPGQLPVTQLVSDSRKKAQDNADHVRRCLIRAAAREVQLDPTVLR